MSAQGPDGYEPIDPSSQHAPQGQPGQWPGQPQSPKGIAAIDAGRANPDDRGKLVAARICGVIAAIGHVIVIMANVALMSSRVSGH